MIRALLRVSCLCLFFILFFFANVFAQQVFKTTSKSVIGYLEYLPDGYKSNAKDYPVVIFLHGIGERGPASNDPKRLADGADLLAKIGPPMHVKKKTKFPFILITPQLKSSYTHWPIAYVMEVIEHVQKTLRIDKNRIYLTGLSMGGFGAWNLAQTYPKFFAAVAPICAGGTLSKAKGIADANLPVWAFHGDRDNVVHVSRSINMVNAINSYNPNPKAKISIYSGVKHDAWVKAYQPNHSVHNPNVYEWMMAQRKNGAPASPENKAPVANAGSDKTIDASLRTFTLNGSGQDPDGTITEYRWSQVSGAKVSMSNERTKNLTISGFSEGEYTFKLTVTDNRGATGSDEVKVRVNPAAKPPVVSAGGDKTLQLPDNKTRLEGSAKMENGKISSYHWSQQSGGHAKLADDNTSTLTVSELKEGEYRFRLTVKGENGLSGHDEVNVVVKKAEILAKPVVSAGGDRTIQLPDNKVTLKGSATIEKGSVASYVWSQRSGGDVKLSDTRDPSLTVSELKEGEYVFRLTAKSDRDVSAYDEVKITVKKAEVFPAPVVSAGEDKSIRLPSDQITLKGSARVERGSITSYQWTQRSGGDVKLTNEKTPELTVSNLKEGEYLFRLAAKTDKGVSGYDEVKIIVRKAEVFPPPVVSAGDNKTVRLPADKTTLTGSATVEKGKIVSYRWSQRAGEPTVMSGENTASLTVESLKEGEYIFRLTAKTDKDLSAYDEVLVVVKKATPNPVPFVSAGNDKTIELPDDNLTLKGSVEIERGSITAVKWTKRSGGKASLSGENTTSLKLSGLEAGEYRFRLEAVSDKGESASDEVKVRVKEPVIHEPVVSAGSDKSITLPVNYTSLDGKAEVKGSRISSYIWTQVSGGKVVISGEKTASLTVTDLEAGIYRFRLTVKSENGLSAYDEVKITVNEASVVSPEVFAGEDQIIQLPASEVTLNGSAKIAQGTIRAYAWKQVSGTTVSLSGTDRPTLIVRGLEEGQYRFRLTATSGEGVSESDEVKITVNAGMNKAPEVSAGSDIVVTLPLDEVIIIGTATDPDGSIESYVWKQESGPELQLAGEDSPTLNVSGLKAGVYSFQLTAKDNYGLTASDKMQLIIKGPEEDDTHSAPGGSSLKAIAGNDKQILLPANAVTFKGNAAADGAIVLYRWIQVGGEEVTIINSDKPVMTVTDIDSPGTHTFRLVIKDEHGNTATDDVRLVVIDPDASSDPDDDETDPDEQWDINPRGAPFDLSNGSASALENFAVVVFDENGKMIFRGRWEDDSFENVFDKPGLYVYHILHEHRKIKAGKIMIKP